MRTTGKLEESQEPFCIRVLGLGWQDLNHPWSKNDRKCTWQELAMHHKSLSTAYLNAHQPIYHLAKMSESIC